MTAMLSCPDSPLLSYLFGKLPFVHSMNERQLTTARNCGLNDWDVVGSRLSASVRGLVNSCRSSCIERFAASANNPTMHLPVLVLQNLPWAER